MDWRSQRPHRRRHETVFVGGDGLRALDAADGTERWAKPDITPYGSVSVADGTAYVGELGRVHAVDVADGDKQWTFRGEAEDFETPTVTDTGVFAGSTTTEGGGGNIYRLDRDSGDHDWCRSLGDRDASATVVAGDTLLVAGSDVVQARAPEDGTIRWTHQEDHGWYTGLAVAGSALYASGEFGVVDAFGEV